MSVFVLDRRKKPLDLCSERRARVLLARGRARVVRRSPFTIRLVDRLAQDSVVHPVAVTVDPGSKITGIAVSREVATEAGLVRHVLALFQVEHRGSQIRDALAARRAFRRRRRGAKLRYRAPRFDNRTRPAGWLPPSLQHRVDTVVSWVARLRRLVPAVTRLAVEQVRFDTQIMQNPEVTGVGYQQGTLWQYEVREYVLEKWGRRCAYCDKADVPLEVEHMVPRSRGGSNRLHNLTLACVPCNRRKGAQRIEDFVTDPARLKRILAHAKAPLRDAAAVNTTRHALVQVLSGFGLQVETSTGGRTKYNRAQFGVPKTHALDAACVGEIAGVSGWNRPTLVLKATGRGAYQRARLDRFGFSRGICTRSKRVCGFATGDMVRADVPGGKKAGTHVGRVAVRASGSFNIQTDQVVVQGISHRYCTLLQRGDGYGRSLLASPRPTSRDARPAIPPRPKGRGFSRRI